MTDRASPAQGHGKPVMRRSPHKKVPPSASASPAAPSSAAVDDESALVNPLVAMQTLLAGDMVAIKQRAKAAQQLASYFCELPTTPSLYSYYEPYLPILVSVITAPIKAAKEVQENALKMLKALGSHSPRQFVDWCALHVSMNPTQDPWYVDWCCGLLQAAETRVPRIQVQVQTPTQVGKTNGHPRAETVEIWDDRSLEYQELDAATAAVFHVWRAVLDNADNEELVFEIAVNVKTLLCYQPAASEQTWRATVAAKIQPHFVDVADVLIGWAMSSTTSNRLHAAIFALLEEMRELWVGNNVFCLQLLESFSRDITTMYSSPSENAEDNVRLDSIIRCSILVAQCVANVAARSSTNGQLRFLDTLLRSYVPSSRFIYSSATVLRLSEFLEAISATHAEQVAPLAMSAIRLLLNQVASLLVARHCEALDALLVLDRACRLSKLCLAAKTSDPASSQHARSLLKDVVACISASPDAGGDQAGVLVLEQVLQLNCFGAARFTTQIVIQVIALLGVEGLQLVADVLESTLEISETSTIAFWSTCFILASKDPRMARLVFNRDVLRKTSNAVQSILRVVAAADAPIVLQQKVLTSGILKLSPAFVGVLQKHTDTRFDASATELLLAHARLCVRLIDTLLPNDCSLEETFRALAWAMVAYPATAAIPDDLITAVISKIERAVLCEDFPLRTEYTELLVAISPRAGKGRDASARIFQLALALSDSSESTAVMVKRMLPCLELTAFAPGAHRRPVTPAPASLWKDVWIPCEMSVGDFELVIGLLSQPETSSDAWYRTCRRIQARIGHAKLHSGHERISLIKATVREAAKWVVQARLRSPLGPPSAIFSSVERMLQGHASHQRSASSAAVSGGEYPSRISAAMMVEFVLAMESLFGIATDLKATDANPESDASKIQGFFRANVAVCDEWLSRIRPTLVELATNLKQLESRMHHSFAVVSTLSRKLEIQSQRQVTGAVSDDARARVVRQAAELETAVFSLAESLCDLGDSDTIVGLQHWWAELLSRIATKREESAATATASLWLQGFALEAEMRYEDAVQCFEAVMNHAMATQHLAGDHISMTMHPLSAAGVSLSSFVGCVRRCGRCFASLRQWKSIQDLHSRCWWFAEIIAPKCQGDQSFADLIELCTAWKDESSLVAALPDLDQLSQHSSPFNSPPLIDVHVATAASTALQKWGALNCIDAWTAADTFRPDTLLESQEKLALVVDRVRLLQFRPSQGCPDAVSLLSLKEHKSVLVDASLISDVSLSIKVRGMERTEFGFDDLGESSLDPTELARLYFGSRPEQRELTPDVEGWWLAMARAARKHKNVGFASFLLNELQRQSSQRYPSICDAALTYEDAALKMCGESPRDGVLALIKLCDSVLHVRADAQVSVAPDAVHVRSLLRLSRTLANVETGDQFAFIEAAMTVVGTRIGQIDEAGLVGYRDSLVKVCLESATEMMPSNPRTWYEFSKWCHHQGRASLDKVASNSGLLELLPEEESDLSSLLDELRESGSLVDETEIRSGVCHMMEEGSLLSNREQRLRVLLSRSLPPGDGHGVLVDRFVALQTRIVSRLLHPLKLAANGYRSFLLAADSGPVSAQSNRLSSRITSVALRLLRMLTRFGSEGDVVDIVTDVLTVGPLAPWGRIVPQLLSRIGHSYHNVSAPVTALLVRLARRYPHLVVYPAITESGRRREGELPGVHLLDNVLAELRDNAPELTDSVERVVEELKRISILWDDAWIWALLKMSGDVNRRISTLEKEAQRVEKNSSLSLEEKAQLAKRKAVAIMKPVLVAVERLWKDTIDRTTSGSTLTPHEKQFVLKYGASISTAIQSFRSYCSVAVTPPSTPDGPDSVTSDSASPVRVWQPFADLLKTLLAAVGRRDRVDLAEIAPSLVRLPHKSKSVLMPGSFSSDDLNLAQMVMVTDVSRTVTILRTKTKPKCLKFVGSDGHVHRYLLKAREDLHLDERMMQFLDTVNEFLRADRTSSSRNLLARNYSVVPLSSDAGLIQMVPDVIPLFQVYTSRVDDVTQVAPVAGSAAGSDSEQIGLPQQQPPTAPFYAKLKQYGIQDVSPAHRTRWPQSVLRRVYEDLVAARPANVIQREMALQSEDFADAWTKLYRFNRSTAVMSVLGYVMGLGDRHLDNMLLCTRTGELLHIDYNVCFDKGRKLKVPEIVPFRLTPILLDALGLTGVEGVFRSAFTNTMRVIRDADSREALLALLEAFVYDPLIDWVGDGKSLSISRDTKQRMDVNVNLSLFLSRARERWQETTACMDRFAAASSTVATSLRQLAEWVGPEVLAQCQRRGHAMEKKRLADDVLGVKEREFRNLMAIRPEDQAELDILREAIEKDQSTLSAFAMECDGRHRQVQEMVTRIQRAVIPESRDVLMSMATAGRLCRAHARIQSITMQIPPSPSTPVWSSMLAGLEARCVSLDEQISTMVDQSSLVIRELAPLLQLYKTKRCEQLQDDQSQVDDVYGDWRGRCMEIVALLKSDRHEDACDALRSAMSTYSSIELRDARGRGYREQLTQGLTKQIEGITAPGPMMATTTSGDLDALIQEFFNFLSTMKLSNSQTQRVVKLVSVQMMLSSLNGLQASDAERSIDAFVSLRDFPVPNHVHTLLRGVLVLREMVVASKGSMKKTLVELLGRSVDESPPSQDPTQFVITRALSILQSLETIYSSSMRRIARSRYSEVTQRQPASDGSTDEDETLITSTFCEISQEMQRLQHTWSDLQLQVEMREIVSKVDDLREGIDTLIWNEAVDARTEASVSEMIVRFVSEILAPVAKTVVEQVVTCEWKIDIDVFRLGASYVDKLAVEAMPALGTTSQSDSDFHTCCELFSTLWSTWSQLSAASVGEADRQHQRCLLTALLRDRERHLAFLEWNESGRSREMLDRIGRLAPAFPMVFEETGRVESSLLEVTQQLEYVASQVGFSCVMGFSAYEAELQSVCKDIQDAYSQIARHFETVRALSEMAVGVNGIETSLKRAGGEAIGGIERSNSTPLGEQEVDQIGCSLLQTTSAHVERVVAIQGGGGNASVIELKKQLAQAQADARQTQLDVLACAESFEKVSGTLIAHPAEAFAQVKQVLEQVAVIKQALRLLGVSHKGDSEIPTDERTSTFVLSENERLVKILRRSVESTTFMPALHDVLVDHEKTHQEMVQSATALAQVLDRFAFATQVALDENDAAGCICAIEELLCTTCAAVAAVDDGSSNEDLLSKTNALLQACCQTFFSAADLADELTKAEEVGGGGDEEVADPDTVSELDDEALATEDENPMEPSDHDLQEGAQTLAVPLRPIAGFQEQNVYGAEVVARIDEKLSGVVVECGSRESLSIEDQSAWLIRAAASVDNLCVMYEGWTPWI